MLLRLSNGLKGIKYLPLRLPTGLKVIRKVIIASRYDENATFCPIYGAPSARHITYDLKVHYKLVIFKTDLERNFRRFSIYYLYLICVLVQI